MLTPFYISSFGGSATMWINNALNQHEKIISYHGTRSIPPYDSGINDMSAEKFAEGLSVSIKNTNNSKVFGAIHGHYGMVMNDAIKKEGGVFCAVIRSPIKRINSLFHHHYQNMLAEGGQSRNKNISIYEDVVEKGFDLVRVDADVGIVVSDVVKKFHWICLGAIMNDVLLIDGIGNSLNFKMESLVKDKEYFVDFIETLTDKKVKVTKSYLNEIFSINRINQHALAETDEMQIYQQWPDVFKFMYNNTIRNNGGESVLEKYQKLGYIVPHDINKDFDIVDNRFKQN